MTERLARLSTRRPWLTVAAWAAALVVFLGIAGQLLESATTTELSLGSSYESSQASERLEGLGSDPLVEVIIVKSDRGRTVDEPEFAAKVQGLFAEVMALGPDKVGRQSFTYYALAALPLFAEQAEQFVSADRTSTLIVIEMVGGLEEAEGNVHEVLDIAHAANEDPDFTVRQSGRASISYENNELALHDLEQGERVGIPVALLVLLLLFGAVVAALVPIFVAIVCIFITLGIVAIIGQWSQVVVFAQLIVTMIGLAVGIDYALLIISRFREEMNAGREKMEAIAHASATAGRTVLFSGMTVIIALAGMFMVPFNFFQSQAASMIIVVAITLVAMLTLLPAMLAILGRRVNALRLPIVGRSIDRAGEETREGGFWDTITHLVMRRPVISLIVVGVPMLALSAVYFTIDTGLSGVDQAPEGTEQRAAFELMEQEFPFGFGVISPVKIVVEGDVTGGEGQAALQRIVAVLADDPRFPSEPRVEFGEGGLAVVTVPIPGNPTSNENADILVDLRDRVLPEAVGDAGVETYVGGLTSEAADVFRIVSFYQPIVFAFVLGFSFIVLMLVFHSIVIPLKAVLMNLLSVGATYGILVLVFQQGVLTDVFGFDRTPVIDTWVPMFLFFILFGLSMDYHVFMISRIKERYDHTGDNRDAVAYGLRTTASLITGAALIMVAVFGAFASGRTLINQQVGFGLAVAVFLDATLVRSVLVPASMELLGKGNWYLPRFLNWLPRLDVEGESAPRT